MPTNNCFNSNIPIELSKGGTNATSMSTSMGLVKYNGTSLVTSSTATLDASNRYVNTAQPAFSVKASLQNNVTGDGTAYTIIFATSTKDQASNFSSTTFTAPVSGFYLLTAWIALYGFNSTSYYGTVSLNVNAATVTAAQGHLGGDLQLNYYWYVPLSIVTYMAATNTATVSTTITGSTKTIAVAAGSTFNGVLLT